MNKLLLLMSVMPYAMFGAAQEKVMKQGMEPVKNSTENIFKFMKMEKQHMQDWLDYKKAKLDAKIAMLKRQKDEMFDIHEREFRQMSKEGLNFGQYLNEKLPEWIKLHEKQNNEWKELAESQYAKGAEIAREHEKQLAEFKKSVMPEEMAKEEVQQAAEENKNKIID